MKIKRRVSKGKKALNAVLAAALSASMVLGAAGIADVLVPTKQETAKAATTSSVLGTQTTTAINVGDTITFADVSTRAKTSMTAKCVGTSGNDLVFVSTGLTSGSWPGNSSGGVNESNHWTSDKYTGGTNDKATNVNNYDSHTKRLVTALGSALDGTLYLPTGTPDSSVDPSETLNIYKTLASSAQSYGADGTFVWLGSPNGANGACCVGTGGVYGSYGARHGSCAVAPAFNLKKSWAIKQGNQFKLGGAAKAEVAATQSKESVNSWETTPVTSIVTDVTNGVTGTSDRYTVDSKLAYMSDSQYTPQILDHDVTDTLTVKSVDNPTFTAKTFTLTVVGANSWVTEDKIASGQTYELSNIAKSTTPGMKIADSLGYIQGDKYVVPGTARSLTDKITFSIGTYSTTKEVSITPNTDVKQDDEGYYVVTDDNGIEWHFLYNDAGQIGYLYAKSANIGKLVTNDNSKTLNIPSTINGITVAGIGTNSSHHPFLNDTNGATGSTVWKNIYIPASVKTIRGYAFAGNTASAKVEIPSTFSPRMRG